MEQNEKMINEEHIKNQLLEITMKFMKDNRITCEETIHQCDWVIENAYGLMENLFKTVEPLLPNEED